MATESTTQITPESTTQITPENAPATSETTVIPDKGKKILPDIDISHIIGLAAVLVTIIAVLVPIYLYFSQRYDSAIASISAKLEEKEKAIQQLNEEIKGLRAQNEVIERYAKNFLNNTIIHMDKLGQDLLFIYSRAELPPEEWRRELVKQKSSVRGHVAVDQLLNRN